MEGIFTISQLFVAGYATKMAVDIVKWVMNKEFVVFRVIAMIAGIVFCVLFNADALAYIGLVPAIPVLGIHYIPLVSNIMTGILAAYLGTDLFDILKTFKNRIPADMLNQLDKIVKMLAQPK